MSHNPNTVKSQDDLPTTNDGKRSSDVLIEAISKAELLQKQLEIAKKYLSLIKRNVSVGSLAYTYVANAQTEIQELNK